MSIRPVPTAAEAFEALTVFVGEIQAGHFDVLAVRSGTVILDFGASNLLPPHPLTSLVDAKVLDTLAAYARSQATPEAVPWSVIVPLVLEVLLRWLFRR